jgi:hypothetical protein
MLDFIGTIVIAAVTVLNVTAVLSTLSVSPGRRFAAALAVGLWVGLAAAFGGAGLLTVSRPFPYIGPFVVFPLVAIAALVAVSPAWRAALLGLPAPLLIGLNVNRVFGVFFLLLAAAGRLSGPFPISAGWGDIAVGVLALPALWLSLQGARGGRSLLAAWNLLGILDLVVAVALGITSVEGSPLQILSVGVGSTAVQMLPWSFIPSVLVPLYLILHGILFVQLRERGRLAAARLPQEAT